MIDFAVRRDCVVAVGRRLHRRQPSRVPGSVEMETARSLPRPGAGTSTPRLRFFWSPSGNLPLSIRPPAPRRERRHGSTAMLKRLLVADVLFLLLLPALGLADDEDARANRLMVEAVRLVQASELESSAEEKYNAPQEGARQPARDRRPSPVHRSGGEARDRSKGRQHLAGRGPRGPGPGAGGHTPEGGCPGAGLGARVRGGRGRVARGRGSGVGRRPGRSRGAVRGRDGGAPSHLAARQGAERRRLVAAPLGWGEHRRCVAARAACVNRGAQRRRAALLRRDREGS